MRAPASEELARVELDPLERQLAETLDDAAMPMHWVGADGTILWANKAELELLGYAREEYVGQLITAFHTEPEVIADILQRLAAGETLVEYPARVRAKDGSTREVIIDSNVRFREGRFIHTRCFTRDVTEKRRLVDAERQARKRAERLAERMGLLAAASRAFSASRLDTDALLQTIAETVVESFADSCGIFMVNDHRSALVPAALRMNDPQAERAARDLLAAEPVPMGVSTLGRVAQSGEPILITDVDQEQLLAATHLPYRDHLRRFPLRSLLVVPVRAESEVVGVLVMARSDPNRSFLSEDQPLAADIAERAGLALSKVRAFESERTARERLMRLQGLIGRLAQASSPEAIARCAVEEGCTATGAATGLMYQRQDDGVQRVVANQGVPAAFLHELSEIDPDGDLPAAKVLRTLEPIWIEDQEQYQRHWPELATRAEHSKRAPAFAAVPLLAHGVCLGVVAFGYMQPHRFSEGERAFICLVAHHCAHALSRTQLLQRTAEAARRAEEANRLKDEFLATVSHELRTPLSSILGWSSILGSERASDPAVVAKGAEVIERNGRAQLRLIEDILDVSRIIQGQVRLDQEPVDLGPIAREVSDAINPSAEAKHIDVEVVCKPPCRVLGDGDRLRQVLWNLLSNAVKFTPVGGKVLLRMAYDSGYVTIEVADTGCGIEPAFLPHVFDRFRQQDGRASRDHGGLGLGLAIVRHLVEMHGGEVSAESEGTDQGTRFIVRLPVRPFMSTGAPQRSSCPPPEHDAVADLVVLVVEDDADTRDIIGRLLSSQGATVRLACGVEEALELLAQKRPDVVVSDIAMPGRDGYELVRQIKRSWPGLPVIALTAFEPDEAHLATTPFEDYLMKPVETSALIEAISRHGRKAISSQQSAVSSRATKTNEDA